MDREMIMTGVMSEENCEPDYSFGERCEDGSLEGPIHEDQTAPISSTWIPGILWSICAAFGLAVHMILVEYLTESVHPVQSLFIRSCFLLIFVLFISWENSREYDSADCLANLLFGLFDVVGMGAGYVAVSRLSVADASAILFNKPIPASIIAWILLGEPFDVSDFILAVINGIGLVILSESTAASTSGTITGSPASGIVLALLGLFFLSCMFNSARWLSLRQREDPSLLGFMSGTFGVWLSAVYLSSTNSWGIPYTARNISLSVALGFATMFEIYAMAMALNNMSVLIVSAIKTAAIPLTYLYVILIFGEVAAWQTFVGVGMTLVTSISICLKSYFQNRSNYYSER